MPNDRSRQLIAPFDIAVSSLTNGATYAFLPNGTVQVVTTPTTGQGILAAGLQPGWGFYSITPEAQSVVWYLIANSSVNPTGASFTMYSLMYPFTPASLAGTSTNAIAPGAPVAIPAFGNSFVNKYSISASSPLDSGTQGAGTALVGRYFMPTMTATTWGGAGIISVALELM